MTTAPALLRHREQIRNRQVPLSGIVTECEHGRAGLYLREFLVHRRESRAGRDSDEDSFLTSGSLCESERFVVVDLHDAVEELRVKILRNKTGADALNRMRAR